MSRRRIAQRSTRFTVVPLRTDPVSLAGADVNSRAGGRNLPCPITQRVLTEDLYEESELFWSLLPALVQGSPELARRRRHPFVSYLERVRLLLFIWGGQGNAGGLSSAY